MWSGVEEPECKENNNYVINIEVAIHHWIGRVLFAFAQRTTTVAVSSSIAKATHSRAATTRNEINLKSVLCILCYIEPRVCEYGAILNCISLYIQIQYIPI